MDEKNETGAERIASANRSVEKKTRVIERLGTPLIEWMSAYFYGTNDASSDEKTYGISRVLQGLGSGALGFLFGRAQMMFGTYPKISGLTTSYLVP